MHEHDKHDRHLEHRLARKCGDKQTTYGYKPRCDGGCCSARPAARQRPIGTLLDVFRIVPAVIPEKAGTVEKNAGQGQFPQLQRMLHTATMLTPRIQMWEMC